MSLPEGDIKELTWALLDEAVDEEHEFTDEINIDQLRAILDKQEVLVDSLTTRSVFSFISKKLFHHITQTNLALLIFFALIE